MGDFVPVLGGILGGVLGSAIPGLGTALGGGLGAALGSTAGTMATGKDPSLMGTLIAGGSGALGGGLLGNAFGSAGNAAGQASNGLSMAGNTMSNAAMQGMDQTMASLAPTATSAMLPEAVGSLAGTAATSVAPAAAMSSNVTSGLAAGGSQLVAPPSTAPALTASYAPAASSNMNELLQQAIIDKLTEKTPMWKQVLPGLISGSAPAALGALLKDDPYRPDHTAFNWPNREDPTSNIRKNRKIQSYLKSRRMV